MCVGKTQFDAPLKEQLGFVKWCCMWNLSIVSVLPIVDGGLPASSKASIRLMNAFCFYVCTTFCFS